jgi:hypothetical protein
MKLQERHVAILMRVGDGNVEVGRHLGLLDLNVSVPPLGGEGGVRTEFLIGKGAERAVEA